MPISIGWPEIALRLVLTVASGALIGFNREEHGQPAGLRTTILVCLAASISMIQVNLLLGIAGKASDSFAVLDLMRLPLGILSGMGFIGAGAIIRKDNLVRGLTTAATLWFVTVMGLCFGAGQIALGLAVLMLAVGVLWGLKWAERYWKQDRRASLTLIATAEGPTEDEIAADLAASDYEIVSWAVTYAENEPRRQLRCEVRWRAYPPDVRLPDFLKTISQHPGVLKLEWNP